FVSGQKTKCRDDLQSRREDLAVRSKFLVFITNSGFWHLLDSIPQTTWTAADTLSKEMFSTKTTADQSTSNSNQTESGRVAWYCLRSQPKHEHIAAAHLRILGVNVFCPRIRFKRKTRLGIVWVTEAMFPGYLFARFELAEMHRKVTYAHGVSGIVRFADRYPAI